MIKNRKWHILFGFYCALMLWLLFARPGYTDGIPYAEQLKYNLQPFQTIVRFSRQLVDPISPEIWRHSVINLFGNIIMFVPLGFCLPIVCSRLNKLWKVTLATALIITLVELTQMLTLVGSCDTDDLMLNVLGCAIGYGLYRLVFKK